MFLSKSKLILTEKPCLDAYASNLDGILSRDTWVSSTQLSIPIGTKLAYLHLEKPYMQKGFLSKAY
jgi:hypothetical protein